MRRGFALVPILVFACAALLAAEDTAAPTPIRVLLVTGQQNHDWPFTSAYMEERLEATGRFEVEVTTTPARDLTDPGLSEQVDLIYLDYNGERWGEAAETAFLAAIEGGVGLVVVHASNNSFAGWDAYDELIGLAWRDGAGHGRFHAFDVEIVDTQHPVTAGLPDMHAHPDELYHRLSAAPEADFQVLMRAYSDTASGGTGKDEPITIALTRGKGRVFHTVLGHVWPGVESTRASLADPQLQMLIARGAEWAATGTVSMTFEDFGMEQPEQIRPAPRPNRLSAAESEAGWRLLFDGQNCDSWRGFKREGLPEQGWTARDGELVHTAGAGGGDIVTRETFGDFELSLEWKIAPGGNSGIMFRVTEDGPATWSTGPEMQVLDDAAHGDGSSTLTSAGALYALVSCREAAVRPAGEWNATRIRVVAGQVDFWLNEKHVVSIDMAGEEFASLVAASKFSSMPGFAKASRGHIALQDHGDEVRFRNIKIRDLPR